jgi:Ni/Co efflux regulator RcnB
LSDNHSRYFFALLNMHKLLSLFIASVSIALSVGASAQTAPSTSQPLAQQAPSVANTDKAPSAEPSKAHKKGKKKKLKKKKARH